MSSANELLLFYSISDVNVTPLYFSAAKSGSVSAAAYRAHGTLELLRRTTADFIAPQTCGHRSNQT